MGWRDKYKVHPAADVFPMMSDDELAALGEDIKKHGLKHAILVLEDSGEVIDGRNRLEAMERAGICQDPQLVYPMDDGDDPVAFIISLNIHRRHLTKAQQADLIVAAHKASRKDCEVPKRHVKGKAGSTKDPIKEAAVNDAAKHGIGKRTVEQAFAKAEGKTPKPEPKASKEEIAAKRKATREANAKAYREAFQEELAERNPEAAKRFMAVVDPSSWQRLAKVIVRLGSEHEGERQSAADLANKILEPMGWQLVKRASTLPQDGRSEVAVDDPTPSSALFATLETELKKRGSR
jgi:hypothetical protein